MRIKQMAICQIANDDTSHFDGKNKNQSKGLRVTLGCAILFLLSVHLCSCKKLIAIPAPTTSITTEEVFADSTDADAAILGIYTSLQATSGNLSFGNGLFTVDCGLSSDEFLPGSNSGYLNLVYYNNLNAGNPGTPVDPLWQQGYAIIYQANASIAGLQASKGISISTKTQLIAEATFLRAFCYFNLVNIYGDVPYETTPDYHTNQVTARTPKTLVYQQLINDLTTCQGSLRHDYSISGGERTRANQASATALLARIYMYTGDYKDAITQSSALINNSSVYSLVQNLNAVFLKNSNEAILQWKVNPTTYPFNTTEEGYNFITNNGNQPNTIYLSNQLLSAFEGGDKRRISWVTADTADQIYYLPYKYKYGPYQSVPNGAPAEYYMVFRLGEQYLIRAESEANLGDLGNAVSDLNIIRSRAGLSGYSGSMDKVSVLSAIYHERQIELFAEWGHRWFDLKRTGQVDAVMSVVTPQKGGGTVWKSTQQLYPIAQSEIQKNPSLIQNPGY